MNLKILASGGDHSAIRLYEVSKELGFDSDFLDYADLVKTYNPDHPEELKLDSDLLLPRQPYVANDPLHQYESLLYLVLQHSKAKKVFDSELFKKAFLLYEDKLYQTYLFQSLQLPYATFYPSSEIEKKDYIPLIARKRISSRGKATFLLPTFDDFKKVQDDDDFGDFIYQEYYPLKNDYRVLVLKGKALGVVVREVMIKEKNRVAVKVTGEATLPSDILEKCLKLTESVGTDLCGIDIGEKQNGELFIIEYNTSPQFVAFERVTGQNVAQKILQSF